MGVAKDKSQGDTAPGGRILVTGASGFIGSALCPALEAAGAAVRRLSRTQRPGFTAIGPIDGQTDWSEALAGCRAVVHLAGRVHDPKASPQDYRRDNVEATLNLARQAAAVGVGRFVFVSTIKVNGEVSPAGRGFVETDTPQPEGPYAQSKLDAEDGLRAIGRDTGLEVVVIRPPLVHGPGVKANLRSLMRAIERGWPLPLGSIHNCRSLVGVRNLCALIALAINHPAAAGKTFLAADGEDVSTTDLLRRLARLMDRPARLIHVPSTLLAAGLRLAGRGAAAQSLLGDLRVDAGEARRLLGWAPEVSLEAGLAEMVGQVPRPRDPGNRPLLDFSRRSA